MLGEHKLSSPSTRLKVNHLCIRYLCFESVRGDLQEGHGYASRCQFLLFLCRSPFFSSTKSGFLSAFAFRNPRFLAIRAQNRGFCAFLAFGTPVFWYFEHKIGIFVRFCPPEPLFSSVSSTKSGFLCFFALRDPRFQAFRAQNWGFCAFLPFGTLVFRHFEHKIEVFVRFCPSKPSFSGISSTKSRFLCSGCR